jgi:hypothetical protein
VVRTDARPGPKIPSAGCASSRGGQAELSRYGGEHSLGHGHCGHGGAIVGHAGPVRRGSLPAKFSRGNCGHPGMWELGDTWDPRVAHASAGKPRGALPLRPPARLGGMAVAAAGMLSSREHARTSCGSMHLMNSTRGAKKIQEVPWTFVASSKDGVPRPVLLSTVDRNALGFRSRRNSRAVKTSQVGRRLEKAFVGAVRAIKRDATK